jgi:protein-L-isoaspartate(D-aspartate) O-methyltransferase
MKPHAASSLSHARQQQEHLRLFEAQRRELVATLRRKGIRDEAVLAAFGALPREEFVHQAFVMDAYNDSALPIGNRQTISQPYTVAVMTAALQMRQGAKILEIGTGSGYQAAILALLGARVWSIERHKPLFDGAFATLKRLQIPVTMKLDDGSLGWQEHAPFEGIIVTAGAPDVPPALTHQLTIGGRLVIPVGDKAVQTLYTITRTGAETFTAQEHQEFRFVPLVGQEGWQHEE